MKVIKHFESVAHQDVSGSIVTGKGYRPGPGGRAYVEGHSDS